MSNDLVQSNSGAAVSGEAATESLPGGGGSDASHAPSAARRAEIDRVRRTDIDRYFAEGMDREELSYLRAELGQETVTDPLPVEQARAELSATPDGARIVSEWERMGGFKLQLQRVQSAVGRMIRNMGDDRAQLAFVERFDRALSDRAQAVVYDEIVAGAPTWADPASTSDLERFASSPVGAELLDEWGSDGPVRVATVWNRVNRLRDALDDEADDFFRWFDDLSPVEAKAIVEAIAQ